MERGEKEKRVKGGGWSAEVVDCTNFLSNREKGEKILLGNQLG